MDDEHVERIALILRAFDLTIAEAEARDGAGDDEQLEMLRSARERWRERAADAERG